MVHKSEPLPASRGDDLFSMALDYLLESDKWPDWELKKTEYGVRAKMGNQVYDCGTWRRGSQTIPASLLAFSKMAEHQSNS